MATLLLATDPTFLLTDTFDWGPVAIEHLLLVTACLALVKYHQERAQNSHPAERWLALGFLCIGLALWNKAVFLWALTGLTIATVAVCRKELLGLLKIRQAGIAIAFFILGASPFLAYNLRHRNATLKTSANLEIPDWGVKFHQLRMALQGTSMFSYMVSEESRELPKPHLSSLGHFTSSVRDRLGSHHSTLTDYAALLCLLAVPLWWKSRPAWFALVFSTVTWLLMAVTRGAGASAHHAVLLWPFPQLFIAIVLAAIPWRAVTWLAAALLGITNLLVLNQYVLQMEQDGAAPLFTDAVYALDRALSAHTSETIYVTDWGIQNVVALLEKGRLKLENAEGDFEGPEITDGIRAHITNMAADQNSIFIGHVAGQEVFEGSRERVARAAESAGLHKQILQIIPDSNGRPMFEIFRWAKAGSDTLP